MNKMGQNYQIIAKYFSKEISEKEKIELKKWLRASSRNRLLFDELSQLWENMETNSSDEDRDRVFSKVKEKIKKDERRTQKFVPVFWYKFAASVILLISVASVTFYQFTEAFSWVNTLGHQVVECPAGTRKNLILADGTQIYMNGDSKLKYKLSTKYRKVYMEGEAFYKVARNENKAFVVNTGKTQVKVLGTSFNLKAYPDDDEQTTSVLSGKVSFSNLRADTSVLLLPGRKGIIGQLNRKLVTTECPLEILWMKNELRFEKTPLSELTKTLYRTYGLKCKLTDESLEQIRITACFQNEEVEEVMKILQMINEFSYQIKGKTIFIGLKNEFANEKIS